MDEDDNTIFADSKCLISDNGKEWIEMTLTISSKFFKAIQKDGEMFKKVELKNISQVHENNFPDLTGDQSGFTVYIENPTSFLNVHSNDNEKWITFLTHMIKKATKKKLNLETKTSKPIKMKSRKKVREERIDFSLLSKIRRLEREKARRQGNKTKEAQLGMEKNNTSSFFREIEKKQKSGALDGNIDEETLRQFGNRISINLNSVAINRRRMRNRKTAAKGKVIPGLKKLNNTLKTTDKNEKKKEEEEEDFETKIAYSDQKEKILVELSKMYEDIKKFEKRSNEEEEQNAKNERKKKGKRHHKRMTTITFNLNQLIKQKTGENGPNKKLSLLTELEKDSFFTIEERNEFKRIQFSRSHLKETDFCFYFDLIGLEGLFIKIIDRPINSLTMIEKSKEEDRFSQFVNTSISNDQNLTEINEVRGIIFSCEALKIIKQDGKFKKQKKILIFSKNFKLAELDDNKRTRERIDQKDILLANEAFPLSDLTCVLLNNKKEDQIKQVCFFYTSKQHNVIYEFIGNGSDSNDYFCKRVFLEVLRTEYHKKMNKKVKFIDTQNIFYFTKLGETEKLIWISKMIKESENQQKTQKGFVSTTPMDYEKIAFFGSKKMLEEGETDLSKFKGDKEILYSKLVMFQKELGGKEREVILIISDLAIYIGKKSKEGNQLFIERRISNKIITDILYMKGIETSSYTDELNGGNNKKKKKFSYFWNEKSVKRI